MNIYTFLIVRPLVWLIYSNKSNKIMIIKTKETAPIKMRKVPLYLQFSCLFKLPYLNIISHRNTEEKYGYPAPSDYYTNRDFAQVLQVSAYPLYS